MPPGVSDRHRIGTGSGMCPTAFRNAVNLNVSVLGIQLPSSLRIAEMEEGMIKVFWFKFQEFWCKLMHPAPMTPIHGYYRCPSCLRKYPVPWAGNGRVPAKPIGLPADVTVS